MVNPTSSLAALANARTTGGPPGLVEQLDTGLRDADTAAATTDVKN
jgi:hypothetical protein